MKKLMFFVIASLVMATACKKDNKDDNNNQPTVPTNDIIVAATDNAISNGMFDDVFKQGTSGTRKMDDSLGGKSSYNSLNSCATITITPFDLVSWPKTVTVDFGNTNCLGSDGYYRRGKLIMTVTTWYHDSGCVVTIVPDNYYVNDHKIEGQKVIKNLGRNSQQHLTYSVEVTNGKVTDPNGTTYRTWNSSRIHEWISGENTWNPWDDEYMVTGNANGITRTAKPYTVVIDTPLNIYTGCKWIRSGQLTLTVQGNPPVIVNYGTTPACDNVAVVTINGVNYTINM